MGVAGVGTDAASGCHVPWSGLARGAEQARRMAAVSPCRAASQAVRQAGSAQWHLPGTLACTDYTR